MFIPAAALVVLAGTTRAVAADPFPAALDLSSLNGTNGFVLNGALADDRSGISVSSAGDVNGDGIDDVLVGANHADPDGNFQAGVTYVVFGAVGLGAGGAVELSSLNGANGFVIKGASGADYSGFSVSAAGDMNGDGFGDIIIGAYTASPSGRLFAGESYVVFGSANIGVGGSFGLASINGTNGFVMNGVDPGDQSGRAVSCAGDVNGDGFDDVIIGALDADRLGEISSGESYVVFGGMGVGSGGSIELSLLDGTNGFVLTGDVEFDLGGRSVSGAGDMNDDGFDDVLVGAVFADPGGRAGAGESYVVFGGANVGSLSSIELPFLNGFTGFTLNGIAVGDESGGSVSSAGDVNGDGIGDIIIGAAQADPGGRSRAGESYVVFGGAGIVAGGTFELSSLNGTNGFTLNGVAMSNRSGYSVSEVGDMNGDGIGDIVIGAFFADPNGQAAAGETYVVFGAPGLGSGGSFELSSLNGTNGFVLRGIDAGDDSGISVSSAGDVNGDGVDDIIIGAYRASPGGRLIAGESYVVFGRSCDPADLDGDGVVGAGDLAILLGSWGDCPLAPIECAADLDGDGSVGSGDLAILLGSWGS